MCKFMYNISTVSSVSVEVGNKIKFEFSKKKKKKKKRAIGNETFYGDGLTRQLHVVVVRWSVLLESTF